MVNFELFNEVNVLIIGDVMIDRYLRGNVTRISPEAPVPVVNLSGEDLRLGGAANVALNVRALGATPMKTDKLFASSYPNTASATSTFFNQKIAAAQSKLG
jgi:bifunctional ADP-heptose synthase (sugar kinase/adenylyltransferase)